MASSCAHFCALPTADRVAWKPASMNVFSTSSKMSSTFRSCVCVFSLSVSAWGMTEDQLLRGRMWHTFTDRISTRPSKKDPAKQVVTYRDAYTVSGEEREHRFRLRRGQQSDAVDKLQEFRGVVAEQIATRLKRTGAYDHLDWLEPGLMGERDLATDMADIEWLVDYWGPRFQRLGFSSDGWELEFPRIRQHALARVELDPGLTRVAPHTQPGMHHVFWHALPLKPTAATIDRFISHLNRCKLGKGGTIDMDELEVLTIIIEDTPDELD
eukprot:gene4267-8704_t